MPHRWPSHHVSKSGASVGEPPPSESSDVVQDLVRALAASGAAGHRRYAPLGTAGIDGSKAVALIVRVTEPDGTEHQIRIEIHPQP